MLAWLPGLSGRLVNAKTLDGVTVVITGDILHSRVARVECDAAAAVGSEGVAVRAYCFIASGCVGAGRGRGD